MLLAMRIGEPHVSRGGPGCEGLAVSEARCVTIGWKNSVRPRADMPQMKSTLAHTLASTVSSPLWP